jgi:hypothetical protein
LCVDVVDLDVNCRRTPAAGLMIVFPKSNTTELSSSKRHRQAAHAGVKTVCLVGRT